MFDFIVLLYGYDDYVGDIVEIVKNFGVIVICNVDLVFFLVVEDGFENIVLMYIGGKR